MGSQKANPKLYPTALTIVGSGWVDKWKWPKNAIMNVNNLIMERVNRERQNKEWKQRKGEVSLHSTCLQEDSHDVSCDLKWYIGPDKIYGPVKFQWAWKINGPIDFVGHDSLHGPDGLHGPMLGLLLHRVPFMVPMVFLVIINSLMCILCYNSENKKRSFKKIIYSVESMHQKTIGTM